MSSVNEHRIKILSDIQQAREQIQSWRRSGEIIAFVPTMGNLHAGHLALVTEAKKIADRVIVSIFVNPTQFGENEDFGTYPRTFKEDVDKLSTIGVDMVFSPETEVMYPTASDHAATVVDVQGMGDILEGEHRPGFFYWCGHCRE